MITEDAERDEAVIATVSAFIRNAERLAELTAAFLVQAGLNLQADIAGWPRGFLLELGAVVQIRVWETSLLKDAVDPTLPDSQSAFADLVDRLLTDPEQLIRGDTTLLKRVLSSWWFSCAHPNQHNFSVDFALPRIERDKLLSRVAELLWKLRDLETGFKAGE